MKRKRKVQTDKFRQFNSEGKVRITKYDKDNETRQGKSTKNRINHQEIGKKLRT